MKISLQILTHWSQPRRATAFIGSGHISKWINTFAVKCHICRQTSTRLNHTMYSKTLGDKENCYCYCILHKQTSKLVVAMKNVCWRNFGTASVRCNVTTLFCLSFARNAPFVFRHYLFLAFICHDNRARSKEGEQQPGSLLAPKARKGAFYLFQRF